MLIYGRELRRQQVVDATTGRSLGRVTQVVWDPKSGQLLGLEVDDGQAKMVRPQQIQAIAPGVITIVPEAAPESPLPELGKRLVTADGREYGRVRDVVFDLTTGQVLAYEIKRAHGRAMIVPALGVTEYPDRIEVSPQAIAASTTDLSALSAMRDPETGAISFPLCEDGLDER